ncbi:hypothetical protein HPP92_025108 [Vanilla planifolia]|uniref:Peptidoglycan binding-like domain-containing protein n=1 Tax=Vanilla planifolia TaxID=51239 RepID=A0A835U8P7_VANPL|nr:hypothetical protein HPP92_025108 [Vanilla planifolia]
MLHPRQEVSFCNRQTFSVKSSFLATFEVRRNQNRSHSFSCVSAAAAGPSSSFSWEHEEQRWLREEQRWLREEQRWLREERRWRDERESLLSEMAALRHRVAALEGAGLAAAVDAVLVPAGERALAAKANPDVVEDAEEVKEILAMKAKRKTLRMGSEGEEVLEMQEALQAFGFYSGEEDMEYSSFSNGTERAVKTWQASVGAMEDGIMTEELLEKLFAERYVTKSMVKGTTDHRDFTSAEKVGGINGAPFSSVTEFAEIQEKVIKKTDEGKVEVSQHRVFLLGENRWEEPSRLGLKAKLNRNQCLTCRGEGRLMCSECDGSGEPNIEPQFLEWVDEGAKCPYCEGPGLYHL